MTIVCPWLKLRRSSVSVSVWLWAWAAALVPRLPRRWRGPSFTLCQPNLNMCVGAAFFAAAAVSAAQWPKLKFTSVSLSQRWFAQRR